jgi:hypothetical protein
MLVLTGFILTATCVPTVAAAADDWKFSVAPYLWGAGIDGTMTVRGYEADVDKSFEDILNDLDFGAMVNLQARRDRLGLYTDVLFLKVSATSDVANPAGATILEATVETEQWIVDFGASWEVASWVKCGEKTGFVDLIVGGRYWNVESEIESSRPVFGGDGKVEKTMDWVDPIVGARFSVTLTPKLSLVGRADVGGFDIGDASELTWSASAYLGWHFTPLVSGWFGWKYLSVEREADRDNSVDLALSGPVLGVAFTF